MSKNQIVIKSVDDIMNYKNSIKVNADKAMINIRSLLHNEIDSMRILKQFKFEHLGYEPVKDYELNLIEQINQTFSDIVLLQAVEELLVKFPDREFLLNHGTKDGHDIISTDNQIIAECFATTNMVNNKKIKKDADKLMTNQIADYKFVFFYAKEANETTLLNIEEDYKKITFKRFKSVDI